MPGAMSTFLITALSLTIMLVPFIHCDYQVEVNLISYNNSARRLQDGSCCDLESGGICLPQHTCDVRFSFSAQNRHTLITFNSQTKVVGTYENSDTIRFPSCSTLMGGVQNPLMFVIPTNQWNAVQQVAILFEISDIDRDPVTGSVTQDFIQGSLSMVRINRPSAPNSTYTSATFNGANSLTLAYQYRVICTAGTCGSDCSQITNCQPFPSCMAITCAASPCLNGGTCSDAPDGDYTCSCPSQCRGRNCETCDDPCGPPNPCLNSGLCSAQGATFTCNCRQGFTGDRCLETASTSMPTSDIIDATVVSTRVTNLTSTDSSLLITIFTVNGVVSPSDGAMVMATWTTLFLSSTALALFSTC